MHGPRLAAIRNPFPLATLALAVASSTFVASCRHADHILYVENDSERAYFVRVQEGSGPAHVAKLPRGGAGYTVAWSGAADHPVELLDLECNVVGAFDPSNANRRLVSGVGGVRGEVRPYPSTLPDDAPWYEASESCGGFVYR